MKVHQGLKCLALLLLMCSFHVTLMAQSQTVSINVKNATLKQVFKAIEKQTTYRISYRNVFIDSRSDISMNKQKAEVAAVLTEALAGRPLEFSIIKPNSIVISDKQSTAQATSRQGKGTRVTGRILDKTGEPMVGVTIREKGTNNGTVNRP